MDGLPPWGSPGMNHHNGLDKLVVRAARSGNLALLQRYLDDPTAQGALKEMTKQGSNIVDFLPIEGDRRTLLASVCKVGNLEAAELLVSQYRADVNLRDHLGWTALYAVTQRADLQVIQYLLLHKADPNCVTNGSGTYYNPDGGDTPLLRVLRSDRRRNDHRYVPIVEALLAAGADPHLRDCSGQSPFMAAMRNQRAAEAQDTNEGEFHRNILGPTNALIIQAATPWSIRTHRLFPPETRRRVFELLSIATRADRASPLGALVNNHDLWMAVVAQSITRPSVGVVSEFGDSSEVRNGGYEVHVHISRQECPHCCDGWEREQESLREQARRREEQERATERREQEQKQEEEARVKRKVEDIKGFELCEEGGCSCNFSETPCKYAKWKRCTECGPKRQLCRKRTCVSRRHCSLPQTNV